jgi:antirestriction protein
VSNLEEESGDQPPEPGPERETLSVTPLVYVASLNDYNAGRLHGSWLDATSDEETLQTGVADMLAGSPDAGAEEWAIHDYEGFGQLRLSEHESLAVVAQIGQGIAEHGLAFAAWADLVDRDPEQLERFEEAHWGTWPTLERYAEDLLENLGIEQQLDQMLDRHQRRYVQVDYMGLARDLELSGDIRTVRRPDGHVDVFQGDI